MKKDRQEVMTKKDIKIFFNRIKEGDFKQVSEILDSNSEFLNVRNFAPPKSEDGQSGLQVSFKTGNFEIAKLLLEKGADVNFMETSEFNEWTAPVLHDCIRATLFNSYTFQKDTKQFDKAFYLLKLMLRRNANPNSTDSYGNNCLHRAILDARQTLNNPNTDFKNDILIKQLRSVFNELINAGANIKQSEEKRESAEELYLSFQLDKYKLW